MKKVIVTGGSGFICSKIVKILKKDKKSQILVIKIAFKDILLD